METIKISISAILQILIFVEKILLSTGNGSPPISPTTVHITVNCLPNTPPISVDDHLTDFTTEDTESSFQVGDILSNDTDPDTASGDSIV